MRYTQVQYSTIAKNMIRYGGSFVKCLGEALLRADRSNSIKLENAFEDYFKEYLGKSV